MVLALQSEDTITVLHQTHTNNKFNYALMFSITYDFCRRVSDWHTVKMET
jgi:hypothetical protein